MILRPAIALTVGIVSILAVILSSDSSSGATMVQILDLLSKLVLPFVLAAMTLIGKGVWNLHQRLGEIESTLADHHTTLYGDDDDANIEGLTHDIAEMSDQTDRIESCLLRIEDEFEDDE